jgi:hypothetical protein
MASDLTVPADSTFEFELELPDICVVFATRVHRQGNSLAMNGNPGGFREGTRVTADRRRRIHNKFLHLAIKSVISSMLVSSDQFEGVEDATKGLSFKLSMF